MEEVEKDVVIMMAIILKSISLTCIALFFDFAIQERQVLGFYRKLLNRLYQRGTKLIAKKAQQQKVTIAGKEQNVSVMHPPKRHDRILGKIYRTIFNIAGGCIYCTNPYMTTILMLLLFNDTSIVNIVCVIGINHVLIRIFKSKIQ